MSRRTEMLELAILGLLQEAPLHGYELRKRVHRVLGTVRALSYGTLYPRLRDMVVRGHIVEAARPVTGRRARISYALTPAGQQRFEELLSSAGPSAWEDDAFAVHFAFFGLTDASVRLRILEGRRARLEERLARIRTGGPVLRGASTHDTYTTELYRHGVESAEADLRWITRMIEAERSTHDRAATPRSTQDKE